MQASFSILALIVATEGGNPLPVEDNPWDFLADLRSGNSTAVTRAIQRDPSLLFTRTDDGLTPLHLAVLSRNLETVKTLLQNGADVNATDEQGVSPLHLAAFLNLTKIARLLLEQGADPNARTTSGETPLHWCAFQDAAEVAEILLHYGAFLTGTPSPLERAMEQNADNLLLLLKTNSPTPFHQKSASSVSPTILLYPDGTIYTGAMVHGRFHGFGELVFPDGERYLGQWKKGRRDGTGKASWPDGSSYDGEWKADRRDGQGTAQFATGDLYAGEWKTDAFHGTGVYHFSDGGAITGLWHKGRLIKGEGSFRISGNRSAYSGSWRNNQPDGKGVFTFPDGTAWEGQWKKGIPRLSLR